MNKERRSRYLCWRRLCVLGLMVQSILFSPLAQQTHAPQLHRRSEPREAMRTAANVQKPVYVPEEASGEYQLGQPGEVIQITLEPSGLSGYISKLGERDSDRGTPLTFFFSRSSVGGQRLEFETAVVHGVWYSFSGTVVRGQATTQQQEGYYRLVGSLIAHDMVQNAEQRRSVDLKLSREL